MRRLPGAAVAALLLPLGGCLAWGIDASCLPFSVPAARAGDAATYAAEGTFWSMPTGTVILDWEPGPAPSGRQNEALTLPRGSRVQLRVAEDDAPVLAADGALRPARRVAFEAWDATRNRTLPFAEEWLGGDGRLLQSVRRNMLQLPGDEAMHQVRFTREGHPALLTSAALWNRTLGPGTVSWGIPGETPFPSAARPAVELRQELRSLHRADGGCVAEVAWTFIEPGGGGARIDTRWESRTPLPMAYAVSFPTEDATEVRPLSMALLGWERGQGPELQPWNASAGWTPTLPTAHRARFLDEPSWRNGTAPREALAAARNDVAAAAWHAAHPDAELVKVRHRLGGPGTDVLDEWTFTWRGGPEEGLATAVQARPSGATQVRTQPERAVRPPAAVASLPTLAGLAELHARAYGAPMEVLDCDLARPACSLGTHRGTGMPRAGAPGGAAHIHPGLVVGMDTGLVLQEDSTSYWQETSYIGVIG